jgi:hypothetical protein
MSLNPSRLFATSEQCFDDETTSLVGQAFDKVCSKLRDQRQRHSLKESIAKRLIAIAGRGERDPEKMGEAAMISLGLKRNRFAY